MTTEQKQSIAMLLDNLPEDWGFLVCTFPMAHLGKLNYVTNLSTRGAEMVVFRLGEELSRRSLQEKLS